MATDVSREQFYQQRDKRKALFLSLGLKPFQILLTVGIWLNALAAVVVVFYLYMRGDGLRFSLFYRPIVDLLLWSFHFWYLRLSFIILAVTGAEGILGFCMRPRWDYFSLSYLLGCILITVGAAVSWVKMRDKIFSSKIT